MICPHYCAGCEVSRSCPSQWVSGFRYRGMFPILGGLADAAVVGSSLVAEIERSRSPAEASSALRERIGVLKQAARHGLSRREVAP